MTSPVRPSLLLGLCLAAYLGNPAAAPVPSPDQAAPAAGPARVGVDRDAHGCIGSAGYAWCARTQRCERPWELAAAEGFDNTAEGFEAFCTGRKK